MKTKYIVVTGGVISGVGKGITGSSIGAILKAQGHTVFMQKLDGYFNIDAGTMNPFRHGEVFVLDDGTEADLDIGHYERFIDENLNRNAIFTSGKIYSEVMAKERRGDYLGRDIQVIPHITDMVKEKIRTAAAESKAEVMIVEIGGTVGEIENAHYMEAVRQMHREEGSENILFVHVVFVPHIRATDELKTKPAQQSFMLLRNLGLQPNIIVARSDEPLQTEHIEKLSLFADVPPEAIIPAPTVKTIYEVPLRFEERSISRLISDHFGWGFKKPSLAHWQRLVDMVTEEKPTIHIGIAGKYTSLDDAYLSVLESLKIASWHQKRNVNVVWIDTEKIEAQDPAEWKKLTQVQGVIVPGGFGNRGIEGMIEVARYAREHRIPYFGLCLGSQIMMIEFARHVLGLSRATSEEFDAAAEHKVVHFLPDQSEGRAKGGTLRLGAYECIVKKGSKAFDAYKTNKISERHRHRYEFNNQYKDALEEAGIVISGSSPDGQLMEIVEVKDHPFMLGTQFHPEFLSNPHDPHPLFSAFIKSVLDGEK